MIEFTIDVDDTKGNRAITVSGSEIEGAVVMVNGQIDGAASFASDATANIETNGC